MMSRDRDGDINYLSPPSPPHLSSPLLIQVVLFYEGQNITLVKHVSVMARDRFIRTQAVLSCFITFCYVIHKSVLVDL